MYKSFYYKLINFSLFFVFCFSFLNLQNANAFSWSEFFGSYFGAVAVLPAEQQITVVNSSLPGLIKAALSSSGFGGYFSEKNSTQNNEIYDLNTSSVERVKNSSVCQSGDFADQVECDRLKDQAAENDLKKAELKKESGILQKLQNGAENSSTEASQSGGGGGTPSSGSSDSQASSGSNETPQSASQGGSAANSSDPNAGSGSTSGDTQQASSNNQNIEIPANIPAECRANWGATFSGSCGSVAELDMKVKKALMEACAVIKKPVPVNSAYRDPACNKKVGGAGKSMHMSRLAVDINAGALGENAKSVWIVFKRNNFKGIGCYNPNTVHLDLRSQDIRWGKGPEGYLSKYYSPSNCPKYLLEVFNTSGNASVPTS